MKQGIVRAHPYPKNADPIACFRDNKLLKKHVDYKAAKGGNVEAAIRLVSELVKPESLAAAKAKFGNDAVYLPVMAQEMTGINQIPNALAAHYAANTGGVKGSGIFQISKAYHTGADAMERLIARDEFDGDVVPGQRYVLVDDVSTMGCTLADLASYIQDSGGEVVGAILLTNASRASTIYPNKKIISSLGERHGQAINNVFGIEPSALTHDEAQYLIGFRTTDELRSRAASAISNRSRRIAAKTLSRSHNHLTTRFPTAVLADQSTAKLLNHGMASHFQDKSWENAYVHAELPDALQELRRAVRDGFDKELVGIIPTAERFDTFNGINYGGKIYVNLRFDVGFTNIVGHELYHQIKKDRPDLHAWFASRARQYYRNLPEYQSRLNKLRQDGEQEISLDAAEEELLANFTGDALADPKFLATLAKANGGKFRQLMKASSRWLELVGHKLQGKDLGSSQYFNEVETLREHLNQVLTAYSRQDGIKQIAAIDSSAITCLPLFAHQQSPYPKEIKPFKDGMANFFQNKRLGDGMSNDVMHERIKP